MLSWPDFDIMSFGCSYSMNVYVCILGLTFFYSWAVFGTGLTIHDESMNLFSILHMMQLMQEMKFHITCYVVLCIVISIHIKLRLYR